MAKLRLGILGFGEAGQSVATGFKNAATAEHPIEKVGEKLRAMMPWIAERRLVDTAKN